MAKNQGNISKKEILLLLLSFGAMFFAEVPLIADYSLFPKLMISVGVILLLSLFNKKITTKYHRTFYYCFLLMLLSFLFSVSFSLNPYDGIYHFFSFLIAALLAFYVINEVETTTRIKYIGLFSAIFTFILTSQTLAHLLGAMANGDYTHQLTYLNRFSFGHRNIYANFLVLNVPLILLALVNQNKTRPKLLLCIPIVLIFSTVLLLQSRSAALSLLAISLVICYGALVIYFKINKRRVVVFTTTLFFCVLIIAFLGKENIKAYVTPSYGSGQERLELWKYSLEEFKESPLYGNGYGNWKINILKYPINTDQSNSGVVCYQRAHNDYIQVLTESGIIGFILYIFFFALVLSFIIKSSNHSKFHKVLAISSIAGYATVSMFSFPLERIELLFALFIMVFPFCKNENGLALKYKPVVLVFSLCAIIFLALRFTNERYYFNAKQAELDGNPALANKYYNQINSSFYSIDATSTPIDWYAGNDLLNQQDYIGGLDYFKRAEDHSPYHPHLLNNLAATYFHLGQNFESEKYYKKCLKYHPKFNEAIINYSAMLFSNNQTEKALITLHKMYVKNQHVNFNPFYLVIVKKFVFEKYHLENFYNDNQYIDMSLHCRYNNINIVSDLEQRINAR